MSNEDTKNLIAGEAGSRYPISTVSTFDPQFDAEYEPDNWRKAGNNENFRKALSSALNSDYSRCAGANVPEDYVSAHHSGEVHQRGWNRFTEIGDMVVGEIPLMRRRPEYRDSGRASWRVEGVTSRYAAVQSSTEVNPGIRRFGCGTADGIAVAGN